MFKAIIDGQGVGVGQDDLRFIRGAEGTVLHLFYSHSDTRMGFGKIIRNNMITLSYSRTVPIASHSLS